ncbi:MAG: hypothetical protein IMZ54_07800 [Acidobacteria bacterium]|nr:hypothetical protein [Acidobacteriota bacterium]
MTRFRLIANVLVAVALAAILFGLVAIVVNDRCSKNVSEDEAANTGIQQQVEFKK